jgi:hypothetical protein
MNIKTVREIFTRLSSSQAKTPLGRWNISNNNNKENTLKIRYANEDNCGVCYHNYTKRNKVVDDDNKYWDTNRPISKCEFHIFRKK